MRFRIRGRSGEQIWLAENVAYERERLIAQQDHGQSRAVHRLEFDREAGFG